MEFRQLEYFVAVAEELSFTRGSRRAHVVQSAISAAIGKLERELGEELFDRSGQQIALTAAGQALLPQARSILDAVQGARDAVDQARGGLRGTVAIGTMLSTGPVDLSRILGRFHATHPGVRVRLHQTFTGSAGNVQAVLDGTVDLALVSVLGRPPAGVTLRALATERLCLVCSPDDPLARSTGLALADLSDATFIDFPVGWGTRAIVDHAFAAAGHTRAVPFEVADYSAGAGLVRQGLGVSFVPATAAEAMTDLHHLEIGGLELLWTISLATATTRRLSAAARALLADPDLTAAPR